MTTQLGFDELDRAAILDRALEHAGDDWQAAALKGIAQLAGTGVIFQAYDLTRPAVGVPQPNHAARWGAVFSHAAKLGLIERIGYAPSARPATRGSAAATWRGVGVTPAPDGPPVKALSIKRPWTAHILAGAKTIENRTWITRHRGPLVIHASRGWDAAAPDSDNIALAGSFGYVGVVELVDVCTATITDTPRSCPCMATGWALPGFAHWQLANAVPFGLPIPGRGRLQLWTPPLDVIQSARRAAASADRLESTA